MYYAPLYFCIRLGTYCLPENPLRPSTDAISITYPTVLKSVQDCKPVLRWFVRSKPYSKHIFLTFKILTYYYINLLYSYYCSVIPYRVMHAARIKHQWTYTLWKGSFLPFPYEGKGELSVILEALPSSTYSMHLIHGLLDIPCWDSLRV